MYTIEYRESEMKKSVTITARITPALNKKLVAYAKAAKRSKSWLIEDIIDRYVDGEIAFVEAVNVGIRELDAQRASLARKDARATIYDTAPELFSESIALLLRHGDVIRIGHTRLVFQQEQA